MRSVQEQLRLAIARYNYAQFTGQADVAAVGTLVEMQGIVNREGEEIRRQLLSADPSLEDDPDRLKEAVVSNLRARFGSFQ